MEGCETITIKAAAERYEKHLIRELPFPQEVESQMCDDIARPS